MKYVIVVLLALWGECVVSNVSVATESFIVREGRPEAQIVVAKNSPRTTQLAAKELQYYIEKISKARLPIVNEPSDKLPVTIFVGHSIYTDRLGISDVGLKDGAYRIVSDDDWLVLIGNDENFTPIEPWPRSHSDWTSGRVHQEWDAITGETWGNPLSQLRKHYTGSTSTFGKPSHEQLSQTGDVHVWGFDERGSYNAVCGYLRSLGMRWYMPGEIGEVLPSMASISLPSIDETVRPDFSIRRVNFRFGVHGQETAQWAMRLGIRDPYGLQIAHGMSTMTDRPEILETRPDWFALYGGQRHNDVDVHTNQLCYSNEELFHETVRYVRALLDHYGYDTVSVMPPDGFVAICQCPKCEGKASPERNNRGLLSDYVWDFVNRVAREVRKTHPDKRISCCAYGTYTLPPLKIDKLEPNVLVCIVGGRRPMNNRPEQQAEIRRLREAWIAKTDNPIMVFENYPFTGRGFYLPAFTPHSIGESINATKGVSQGEDIWLSVGRDFGSDDGIGLNHFLVYFTTRMYWGGPEQDVDVMFDQYCRLFYGPASEEMKTFFEYCEANWQDMERDKSLVDGALSLFDAAKQKTPTESIYSRRIDLIDNYLDGLRAKRVQLEQRRGPVPTLRLVGTVDSEIVIDGVLNEQAWHKCPIAATGILREIQTAHRPTFETSFKAAWHGNDLYLAIRCNEHPGEQLNVGTTTNDDQAIWYGDAVEILLETESHSYYQIAINPAGAVVDLDRGASKNAWFNWDSQAEVATQIADDHWTVEIRIPVTQDENDPLHQVIGNKPTQSLPWHINVCRQRVRKNGSEYSAFSPTGKAAFHEPLKFAYFYDGRSKHFDFDSTVTDYIIASRKASELISQRKYTEAMASWIAISETDVSALQKSDALKQAAACARTFKDFEKATELAGRIPIDAVSKMVRMQNFTAQHQASELVDQFEHEDIASWPFWAAGEAYYLRGRALADIGSGKAAESDLAAALEFTSDRRNRTAVLLAIGRNREQNLQDDAGALAAYREIIDHTTRLGSADQFYAVQGAARVLTKSEKFDDALAVLNRVNIDDLHGFWRGSMLLAKGDTLRAAVRIEDALAVYRTALKDETVEPTHRKAAAAAIQTIEGLIKD